MLRQNMVQFSLIMLQLTRSSIYFIQKDTERSLGSFRPQINKKSLEIASKLGDPFERLASINGERQKQLKKKAQQEMDRDLTFKPKINKSSEVLDEHFKNHLFNGDQLYRWDQLYLMVILSLILKGFSYENQSRKINTISANK